MQQTIVLLFLISQLTGLIDLKTVFPIVKGLTVIDLSSSGLGVLGICEICVEQKILVMDEMKQYEIL